MMVCRALSPVPKLRTLKPFFWSLAWASMERFMLEEQQTAILSWPVSPPSLDGILYFFMTRQTSEI